MLAATSRKRTLKVILDSNALLVPIQFKIDIFSELDRLINRNFDLILLTPVKRELETVAQKSSPKVRKQAIYALQLAEKCKLVDVEMGLTKEVDDIILETAKKWQAAVFTNDVQLRKRLRDISVPVIYVRQKLRLEIDGLI